VSLDKNLAAQTERKNALEAELKAQEKQLGQVKDDLVASAQTVQKSEKRLLALDEEIAALKARQSQIEENITADQASIAELVLALSRLRRTPPEAMILSPDAPLRAAQSTMVLKDILPGLQERAAQLKANLEVLQETEQTLLQQQEKAALESETLKTEQKNLEVLVEQRTQIFADTHQDYKEQSRKVEKVAAQSKNLADLVKKLEQQRRADAANAQSKGSAAQATKQAKSDARLPRMGGARMPIAGTIKTQFNQPDNFGAPAQGIDIEGRAGSVVIAPMGGVIRFAGFFKNYGNMVIIEHEKGWHSLIAGFEKIDTVVNQSVNAGEPLGVLHGSAAGDKPVLYYELRHHGKSVNPALKIASLG
jgi:septal ring factor EnvC (AmiA/AmiB activator)